MGYLKQRPKPPKALCSSDTHYELGLVSPSLIHKYLFMREEDLPSEVALYFKQLEELKED